MVTSKNCFNVILEKIYSEITLHFTLYTFYCL